LESKSAAEPTLPASIMDDGAAWTTIYDGSRQTARGGTVAPMRPDSPSAAVRRVANRIAELRREKGITQDEMAERLRCATKNYQRIEYGQNVTIKMLTRIANFLGVTVTDLVPPPPRRPPLAGARRARAPS
jgi:DNA-binding XRE family transcriptional regulator